ncbi:DUF3219 family protein [Oceanobacillus sp. ISL-73]|nr:DUF3219 family protein [Oceanobacillus sp. ISL-73]MBT2652952.1 DUF3219 family protein [Oceanobacillus sp. ISL-73]
MVIVLNNDELIARDVKLKDQNEKTELSFYFKVTSETYHDITVLLYENDFRVQIPEKNITFSATIGQYATSINNLYEEGKEGDFFLLLVEK